MTKQILEEKLTKLYAHKMKVSNFFVKVNI